ncbi:hypothetical protein TWF730_009592 [Orbilia blumenaviensis]|uniref:Uncharacterized protein n=1 Tax=Orbilia blumenaviensis TaxID=1796055 RepID=A0AAV9UVH0_9PEZI
MPFRIHPPRSVLTTSIFSTTAVISFLVVAAPHILPCPVDSRVAADDGKRTKNLRKCPMPRPTDEEHLTAESRITIMKEAGKMTK